jgi:hypothetical protein
MSVTALPGLPDIDDSTATPIPLAPQLTKRHTLAGPLELEVLATSNRPVSSPEEADDEAMAMKSYTSTPAASPSRASFATPDKRGQGAILLRRATGNQRMIVDRGLMDVFSESCATVRSKAQLDHALFLPDTAPDVSRRLSLRDSTMLRRRRSGLEFTNRGNGSLDITFTGEIRGSVIPIRQTRSANGKKRASIPTHRRARSGSASAGGESATEVEVEVEGRIGESADETVTIGGSDFGTLRGGQRITRNSSMTSIAQAQYVGGSYTQSPTAPSRSFNSLRRTGERPLSRTFTFSRHKTSQSIPTLADPHIEQSRPFRRSSTYRAKSMPVSPILSPTHSTDILSLSQPFHPHRHSMSMSNSISQRQTHTPAMSDVSLVQSSGEEVTVYPLGLGYTNRSTTSINDMASGGGGGGKWKSLRRSMSFVKSNASSRTDVSDIAGYDEFGGASGVGVGSGSGGSGSTSNRSSYVDGSGDGEDGLGKKKRSSRLFKGLSRFTPM